MSKKDEKKYFWNLKNQMLDGCGFGDDVTHVYLNDPDRLKKDMALGKVVMSEPIDFDHAKENELAALRIEVEKLQSRNAELETEAKKGGSVKLKEARAKIAYLEKQIEELTDPDKITEVANG